MKTIATVVLFLGLAVGSMPPAHAGGTFGGVSATATVSVTILPPSGMDGSLDVSTQQVRLNPYGSGQFTVSNHFRHAVDITIHTNDVSDMADGCQIHFSPMLSHIPAGEGQTVRILNRGHGGTPCHPTELIVDQSGSTAAQPMRVAVIQ